MRIYFQSTEKARRGLFRIKQGNYDLPVMILRQGASLEVHTLPRVCSAAKRVESQIISSIGNMRVSYGH